MCGGHVRQVGQVIAPHITGGASPAVLIRRSLSGPPLAGDGGGRAGPARAARTASRLAGGGLGLALAWGPGRPRPGGLALGVVLVRVRVGFPFSNILWRIFSGAWLGFLGFVGFFYCWPLCSYCFLLYLSCRGGRGAGPAARAVSRGLLFLGVAMSSQLSSRFFSVPARFSGRCVARVHSATRSVWVWRAPRAGQHPSPACLFWPLSDMPSASGLACAAGAMGLRALVKPASSCAVFSSGPLVGFASGPVVKIELPPRLSASVVRRALVARWLGLGARV